MYVTVVSLIARHFYGSCRNSAYGCKGIQETNGYCQYCYVRGLYSRVQYRTWVHND